MADSYIDFGVDGDLAGDQLTGVFSSLTLDYLSTAHFNVVITNGDIPYVKTTLTSSQFAVTTSPTLTVTLDFAEIPEYSVLAATDSVRISRTTPVDALERSFTDGSVLKASDLTAQHKQLLFNAQEQVDGGIGSLPLDTDGLLDAGSKKIKNIGTGTESHHAVTKEYVDGLALFGSAFGGADPQYWTFVSSATDGDGSNRVYTFPVDSPPAATVDNMFLVEIGGVTQDPAGYNVTLETNGDYLLTLLGGDDEIGDGVAIIVRNFGVSRNVASSAYTNLNDTSDALVIERLAASTTANLFKVMDETTAHLVSIDSTGTIRVGSETDEDINTSISSSKVEVGDYNTDGSDGVSIERAGDKGVLGISGIATAADADPAIQVYRGATEVLKMAYNGDIITTGGLTATGATTLTGGVTDNLNLLTGALQIAGNTSMQIMQIVSATYDASEGNHIVESHSNYKAYGVSVTITPKSTASKIILVGHVRLNSDDSGGNSAGHITSLFVGSTSAAGATMGGSDITGTWMRTLTAAGGDTSQYVITPHNIFYMHEPSTTSATRYDWAIKNAYAANQTQCYPSYNYSQLYAIEIL